MTILGIDTSLRSSGYGVLVADGSRLRALDCGAIKNAPKLPLSACLRTIHARVAELIEQYDPDVLAIEAVIYGKNAGTMLILGEARGAVLAAAANSSTDLPISPAVRFLTTKILASPPASSTALALSYSQFVPGNAGIRNTGLETAAPLEATRFSGL